MKPHPKIRKSIKWGGAVVTVLLVVVWIGSGWWQGGWWDGYVNEAKMACGCLCVSYTTAERSRLEKGVGGWHFKASAPGTPFHWRPIFGHMTRHRIVPAQGQNHWFDLWFPLWIPSAMALGATAAAWRLDTLARRRARLNLCPTRGCNYDRTGLAAGAVCPECGRPPS